MISTLVSIAVIIVGVIIAFWAIDMLAPPTSLRLIGLLKVIVVLIAFVLALQRLGYV